MSDDLISRKALKKAIADATYNFEQIPIRVDEVQAIIDNAPTVNTTFREVVAYECGQKSVEERPTGHWIKEKDCCLLIYRCSNCKKFIWSRETESDEKFEDLSRLDSYRYCPRCGADMRGDKNE